LSGRHRSWRIAVRSRNSFLSAASVNTSVADRLHRHLTSTHPWMLAVGTLLLTLGLLRAKEVARIVLRQWSRAQGYEYEWIALPLANGFGFAFESRGAWLGPYSGTEYSPTAWVEPLPTFLMAASFSLFGDHGRLVLVLLNVLWIGLAAVLIVLCCGRDRVREGILAGLLFLLYHVYVMSRWLYISNTALATFLVVLIAFLLFRTLERPTLRRAAALGITIGIANLVHAGTLLFGATAAALLLVWFGFREHSMWRRALLIALLPLAIISPWTMRNYTVFGEFVPIRTGFGWNLYMGNPALSMTLSTHASRSSVATAPWTGSSVGEIVDRVRQRDNERALRSHAMGLAVAAAPADYESRNEAQRDAYFESLARRWIIDHPMLATRFVFAKVRAFLFGWSWQATLLTLLAIAGVLVNWRDPRAVGLAMLVAVYAAPYALAVPFYYRYRAPIDPLLFILVGLLFARVNMALGRWGRPLRHRTSE
jgi:hypothetical protein